MLTLADIQTPQFQQASGYCTSSSAFIELVNIAVEELVNRGDWPGTLIPIRVCVKNGCVTWPRYVESVRALNTCAASAGVHNVWYSFLNHGHAMSRDNWYGGAYPWIGSGLDMKQMVFQFQAPTYNDIYGVNCTVRVYPDASEDAGATVKIFGLDENGQRLMEYNTATASWDEGVTITVPTITPGTAYGSTSTFVSKIERVVKSVTQKNLRLYAYDSVNDWLFDLAVYEPSETNPSYLRYTLAGYDSSPVPVPTATCSSCACEQSVVALVKLKKLPIVTSTDIIYIDNTRALLNAIRALKSEEANNVGLARAQWESAINGLNRQMENFSPDREFSAKNNIFGGRVFTNKQF